MANWKVDEIREESKITRRNFRHKRGSAHAMELTVCRLRNYCDKVDFLCRTIAKLEK